MKLRSSSVDEIPDRQESSHSSEGADMSRTTHINRSDPRHGVVLVVVLLALAAVVAAMSSLNVALPDIARDTHATQTQLVWVIDAYSLAFAALLLPAGALGDRYGRRVALIGGLSSFRLGSLPPTLFTRPPAPLAP